MTKHPWNLGQVTALLSFFSGVKSIGMELSEFLILTIFDSLFEHRVARLGK
jgi:hypothetical protein